LPENFCAEMQNLQLENSALEKFQGRIEILSIHNLLCRKFASVCQIFVGKVKCLSENCNFLLQQLFWLTTPLVFQAVCIYCLSQTK